ncbi:MAG TPA: DUF4382 domain-containing protein [Chitinophagaceae bacterium]|nr:DUF4382 domain-containing protein [Chitinophagaceae bacterium]
MKLNLSKLILGLGIIAPAFFVYSCQKGSSNAGSSSQPRLQVRLTDSPDPNVKEVWVDIKEVKIKMGDTSEITLNGAHPGLYNLLDLTNGKDTILADAEIPAGTISQIRLVLGSNNYIITKNDERKDLSTPSAQQSGLKVQIHQDVTGGALYRLILDFDAAKSIVKAGNSGNYLLKPVLRVISFLPSGGNVKGVVSPDSILTTVYAIKGVDTVATTSTDTTNGQYWIRDIAEGTYNFSYIPNDTTYKDAQRSVLVTLGQTTIVDTVKLQKK